MDFADHMLALLVAFDPAPDPDAAKQIERHYDRAAALAAARLARYELDAALETADPAAAFAPVATTPPKEPVTKPGKAPP